MIWPPAWRLCLRSEPNSSNLSSGGRFELRDCVGLTYVGSLANKSAQKPVDQVVLSSDNYTRSVGGNLQLASLPQLSFLNIA